MTTCRSFWCNTMKKYELNYIYLGPAKTERKTERKASLTLDAQPFKDAIIGQFKGDWIHLDDLFINQFSLPVKVHHASADWPNVQIYFIAHEASSSIKTMLECLFTGRRQVNRLTIICFQRHVMKGQPSGFDRTFNFLVYLPTEHSAGSSSNDDNLHRSWWRKQVNVLLF